MTDLVRTWEEMLAAEGATLIRGEAGMRLELSDGVTLEPLHPGPELIPTDVEGAANNNSIVMRLTYQEVNENTTPKP